MKKKYIISLILIVIFVSSILIGKKIIKYNNSVNYDDSTKNIQNLNVISRHNEYVVALEDKVSESLTYSVYKTVDGYIFEKQFSLPIGQNVEGRFICWTNNQIYVLGYNPASYDLSSGEVVYKGSLREMLNSTTGRIDRVIGIYDDFIYYTASYNADQFYGKVSLDLSNVTIIQKEDVPEELKN